jgi:hypothetical protein
MTDIRIVTTEGTDTILEESAVQKFADNLRGWLLQPGGGGYDEARRVWNGMIDRRPALIARCAGPADVIAAVRFAREHELLVSVKGGGHNITGNAVCEGGLMIDLSPMKGVRHAPRRASLGVNTIAKPRPSASPAPAGWCRRPALPD